MLRLAGLLFLSALVAGCAPAPQKMSEASRKAIRSTVLRIDPANPATLYYVGPGDSTGGLFGAVGAIVTNPAREESRSTFRNFVEKNGISIEKIVREEFSAALRRSGKLLIAEAAGPGVATLNITIRQYGLTIPNAFYSTLVPLLSLTCEMADDSGKSVWSGSDRLSSVGNPIEAIAVEKFRSDPGAVEGAWRAAAKHVAANIVGQL